MSQTFGFSFPSHMKYEPQSYFSCHSYYYFSWIGFRPFNQDLVAVVKSVRLQWQNTKQQTCAFHAYINYTYVRISFDIIFSQIIDKQKSVLNRVYGICHAEPTSGEDIYSTNNKQIYFSTLCRVDAILLGSTRCTFWCFR